MSQLQLKKISRDIIDHAEQAVVPDRGLPKVVDDYFVQHLKQDEMQHAEVDPRHYEGLRAAVKTEVLPLYEKFRHETAAARERKQKRKVWQYVLGTVAALEILEALFIHGRLAVPQMLVPSLILETFIGFIVYNAAQYIDDLQISSARKRLERAIEALQDKALTDAEYDQRRELLDADVLRAEALEILTAYERAEDFWRDYLKVRHADPTLPSEIKALQATAFEKFLKFHIDGQTSAAARQHRFNRLFIEASEVFISRDREHYVPHHLESLKPQRL
jgi:hypothetical protein